MARTKFEIISEYYEANVDELRIFADSLLNDIEESKDVVQQCFTHLLAMQQNIIPDSIGALVHQMVRNASVSILRKKAIQRTYSKNVTASANALSEYPETRIMAKDMLDRANEQIAMLPEKCRNVYELNIYGGMKVAEIAEKLQINYRYAEKQLGMARKIVRKGLRNVV